MFGLYVGNWLFGVSFRLSLFDFYWDWNRTVFLLSLLFDFWFFCFCLLLDRVKHHRSFFSFLYKLGRHHRSFFSFFGIGFKTFITYIFKMGSDKFNLCYNIFTFGSFKSFANVIFHFTLVWYYYFKKWSR
jgi:hypothetical protein